MYIYSVKIKAQSWGNSLGIRIPAPVAREANILPGSSIELKFDRGNIVLTPVRDVPTYALADLVSKITPNNVPTTDIWGKPVGKEVW
jgi:antitoxin component of MazEF toxin-antitoxin module